MDPAHIAAMFRARGRRGVLPARLQLLVLELINVADLTAISLQTANAPRAASTSTKLKTARNTVAAPILPILAPGEVGQAPARPAHFALVQRLAAVLTAPQSPTRNALAVGFR